MKERTRPQIATKHLLLWMGFYSAASLLHFAHNATYLHAYPNLPAWLTSNGVYAAWIAVTLVGAMGYGIHRLANPQLGLAVIAVYALLGFGGFDHYWVAPIAAHTLAMNATIFFEAITAAALLIYVVSSARNFKAE
jgi:hypothetical protein